MGAVGEGRSILAMAGLATPMAIRVAATLGLVEAAGTSGATADEIAARTGTFAPALRQLLDHLVAVEVFDCDSAGRYLPTSLGDQMRADSPDGVKVLLDMNTAGGRAELGFVELLGTITEGTPGYVRRYGRSFWSDLDADPALRRSFDVQMHWRFRTLAGQIAERFDWGRFANILDVGGGDGMLLEAILGHHPGARGRVLELAPTAEAATRRFEASGLGDRAAGVVGSFFDPIPAGADAYVLCDILHDWNDRDACAILTACGRAAGAAGVVVVIEAIRGRGADTAIDLFMLMCFGGRERTVEELIEMAARCGLGSPVEVAVAEGRTALEFRPNTAKCHG